MSSPVAFGILAGIGQPHAMRFLPRTSPTWPTTTACWRSMLLAGTCVVFTRRTVRLVGPTAVMVQFRLNTPPGRIPFAKLTVCVSQGRALKAMLL